MSCLALFIRNEQDTGHKMGDLFNLMAFVALIDFLGKNI